MVLLQQALIKPNSCSMTLPFKWPRTKQFELTSSSQIWTWVSFDEQAKLAWNDCLKLYGNTINHPNQSKSTNNPIDAQTWLSAVIVTNKPAKMALVTSTWPLIQTLPPMLGNFSKLLSNSLAINKATVTSFSSHRNFAKQIGNRRLLAHGFPSWLSATNRKLLQKIDALPKANIMVAQDGSGNV